jgi:hypothetical protein
MYPQSNLGKLFWDKVYERAHEQFGTTNIPVNTFNKVWIVPDEALVYENGNTAYVVKSHLKVMLEEDYLSLARHTAIQNPDPQKSVLHSVSSAIIKQIILPEIEQEVNEGKNFATLRQIFSGMVLATWYKEALRESLLGQVYADKAKVLGVNQDPKNNDMIYHRYLVAFKKGVYNFIQEDTDRYTGEVIPRKYFAGGFERLAGDVHSMQVSNEAMAAVTRVDSAYEDLAAVELNTAALFAQLEARDTGAEEFEIYMHLQNSQAAQDIPALRFNPHRTGKEVMAELNATVIPWEKQKGTKFNFSQNFAGLYDEFREIVNGNPSSVNIMVLMNGFIEGLLEPSPLPDGKVSMSARLRKAVLRAARALGEVGSRNAAMVVGYPKLVIDNNGPQKSLKGISLRSAIGLAITNLTKSQPKGWEMAVGKLNDLRFQSLNRRVVEEFEEIYNDFAKEIGEIVFYLPQFNGHTDEYRWVPERPRQQRLQLAAVNGVPLGILPSTNARQRPLDLSRETPMPPAAMKVGPRINKSSLEKVIDFDQLNESYVGHPVEFDENGRRVSGILSWFSKTLKVIQVKFADGMVHHYRWVKGDVLLINLIPVYRRDAVVDHAALAVKPKATNADTDLGGIDLNAANMNFMIKRDGNGVPLPLAQQDMAQLSRIKGFVPKILDIKPVTVSY